ncbi:MAG: cell division protein ZapB [Desulfobulbaceae bacterium]|nr:cell division protein ZapB [Desulfobulbaceae bacterium]
MENKSEFERLESFIDKMLDNYKSLKTRYTELEENFLQLQGDFEEMEEEVNRLRSERTVVEERVSGLIRRIEDWQAAYSEAHAGDDASPASIESGTAPTGEEKPVSAESENRHSHDPGHQIVGQ